MVISRQTVPFIAAAGLLLASLLFAGCANAFLSSQPIRVSPNSGPQSRFFSALSGDGYTPYKMYGVKEGDTMVVLVGVRVDADKETRQTYDSVYDHAITLAKEYGIATGEKERLKVVLVEATTKEKVLESRDFSPRSTISLVPSSLS
ncbi:MAG: hypothetical protein M1389_08340 [Chloroflexi bacterium]|nr:hypothetical protein [Chloroflexota bacterium]